MTGPRDDAATAAAVEALVQAIQAKDRQERPSELHPAPRMQGQRAPDPTSAALRRPWAPLAWDWNPSERGPVPGLVDRQRWATVIHDEAERQDRYGRPAAVVIGELVGLDPRQVTRATDRLVPHSHGSSCR